MASNLSERIDTYRNAVGTRISNPATRTAIAKECMAVATAEEADLRTEVERLRAGESAPDDVRPADCWPTPAQFIRQWNELTAAERLDEAAQIINTRERESSARIRGVVEGR
ncbi:MAG TPA: hypothetical protein VIM47_00875 [Dermatophilaceae bacterium]|jgi:hypothetical protein